MTGSGSNYLAQISGQAALTPVFYKIIASDGTEENTFFGSYVVGNEPFAGTLTSIYDIQGQVAASPLAGQVISTSGIVTGAFGSNFFIQDGTGPWNGVYVYESGYFPQIGDSVIVTAEVVEYYNLTELKNVSAYYHISSYNLLPEPIVLLTGNMQDEQYEGSLVKLLDATCVRDTSYGMWFVDDGSGDALIHNSSIFSFNYIIGDVYTITGPLQFDYGEFKIELRSEDDVLAGIDSYPPTILSVQATNQTIVNISFSEELEATTAVSLSNYSINNGVTVTNASLHTFDKTKIILTVSGMVNGSYTLTVDNVEDLAGNPIDNVQVDFSLNTSIYETEINNVSIYPNPSNKFFYIDFDSNLQGDAIIEIMDFTGRLVFNKTVSISSTQHIIPVSLNSKGIYLINIQTQKKNLTSKIVIE